MLKRIYLAGKVTGRNYERVYREFSDAKRFLLAQGFDEVVNPCELVVPGTTWADAMLILLPYLAACNYLALLPGYERSNGAMCEYWFARGMENEGHMKAIIHITIEKTTAIARSITNIETSDTLKQAI
jgi:hypothetical protein